MTHRRTNRSADLPHPVFSRLYAGASVRMESAGMAELRSELLAGLHGTVVEVGCGNGLNFGRYPSTVVREVAVEPEPTLRALAVRTAAKAPVTVQVQAGTASGLPVADGAADAVVLCLVLCSVHERDSALDEVRRVLRPGGRVRLLEHTVADTPGLRRVQRIADATIWPYLTGGCRTATDPLRDIAVAGFELGEHRRFRFPADGPALPASPHVLGEAFAPS